jgi:T5SS/PEP-CTERM-associated repeat protein
VNNAYAADRYWVDVDGGSFGTPGLVSGSWSTTAAGPSGATAPGASDTARFTLSNTYTVTFPTDPINQSFNVQSGSVTFDLLNRTYITSSATGGLIASQAGQNARLTVINGTLAVTSAAHDIHIGLNTDSVGYLTVSTGGTLGGRPDVVAGTMGTATVNVLNGGDIDGARAFLGQSAGGVGTGFVSGMGSTWTNSSESYIGYQGVGNLHVSSGGYFESAVFVSLGDQPGSNGTVTVSGDGSAISMSLARIGGFGVGSLSIQNGALAVDQGAAVGLNAGSEGFVTVSDAGSHWNSESSTIGSEGTAAVLVERGARWTSWNTTLGNGSSGVGTVTVRDAGTLWRSTGNVSVGSSGTGVLNVRNDADVVIDGALTISDPAGAQVGTVNLEGGSITAQDVHRHAGAALNWTDGTLTVHRGMFNNSSANLVLNGGVADDLPTLRLTGGAFSSASNHPVLTVGSTRRGALELTGGSNLQTNTTHIGSIAGDGVVTVSSGSALYSSGDINVAGTTDRGGTGIVNLHDGGSLFAVGTLRLWSGGTVNINDGTVSFGSFMPLGGRVNFNAGRIQAISNFTAEDPALDALLGPAHVLGVGRTLDVLGNTLTIAAPITVDGGTIAGNILTLNAGLDNHVRGAGTIAFSNGVFNAAGARLFVENGTVGAGSTLTNNGELHLGGEQAKIIGNLLSNNGLLRGNGQVGAETINAGTIEAIGSTIGFERNVTNEAGGMIAARNALLRFRGPGGLLNNGTLGLSFGTSDVFGAVANGSGGKTIVSGNSNATFYGPMTVHGGGELRVSTGSTAVFFGNVTNNGTVSGGGTKLFEGGSVGVMGALHTGGSTIVESGAMVSASSIRESSLTVNGLVHVAANGAEAGVSAISSLSVGAGGLLDLADNDLLVDYDGPSVESYVRGLVIAGRATGQGIVTLETGLDDTVLAVADNADFGRSMWLDQSIDTSTIIGKYTFFGDANLDGKVTGDDYVAVDSNLGTGNSWLEGDFNMDGRTSGDDYVAIDSNLGKGTADPLAFAELKAEMVALHAERFGQDYLAALAQAEADGFGSLVPEPGSLGLLMLAIPALQRRRRR